MAALTLAVGNRFGSEYLVDGSLPITGVDVETISVGLAPAPIFNAMVTTIPYDVGELAFAHYIIARDLGVPLVALPIFPSRFFPQLGLTTHRDLGLDSPADLVGKRVGAAAGLGSNPAVWLRSMLLHMHDVPWETMTWVLPPRDSLTGVDFPVSRRFRIERGDDLQRMLESKEIDALVGTGSGAPSDLTPRLLSDPYEDMDRFVKQHGFFPINTALVGRPQTFAQNPALAPSLMAAFGEARRRHHAAIAGQAGDHQGVDLAWLRERGLFPDQHGLEANRPAITMVIHYCYEQGLIKRLCEPEELFVEV